MSSGEKEGKKEEIEENNWHEQSDEEESEEEKKEEEPKTKKPKEKQSLVRDKNGEILITKLDDYVEPEKQIKEAKGDIRDANIYNFSSLVKAEQDEEEGQEKK